MVKKRKKHLKIEKGWDKTHDAINYFSIQGIPKIILVNSNGFIDYIGHPSNIKLEDRIN